MSLKQLARLRTSMATVYMRKGNYVKNNSYDNFVLALLVAQKCIEREIFDAFFEHWYVHSNYELKT